jgi:hypothetical protein
MVASAGRSNKKGVVQVKRRIAGVCTAATLMLGLWIAPARAADVTVEPVAWQLTAEACSELPAGTTVDGSGVLRTVTTSTAERTIVIAHATGTATDQNGTTYHWIYSNEAISTASSTLIIDHFSLSGPGSARLSNGFVVRFTADAVDVIHAHGDPLDFETFEAHCDPL